jgi:hypothetical protein
MRADCRGMIDIGFDENDIVPGTDEMSTDDASDGAGADDDERR